MAAQFLSFALANNKRLSAKNTCEKPGPPREVPFHYLFIYLFYLKSYSKYTHYIGGGDQIELTSN